MIARVHPSKILGKINVPASKSAMQRACALALLHNGTTRIENPGKSDDDLAAIHIIQQLGVQTTFFEGSLSVKSTGQIDFGGKLNCGESGLSLRMFAAIASLSNNEIVLSGRGSLLRRPVHFFEQVFPLLGIAVETNKGFLPVKMKGPLQPADICIDGSVSSQYLTGLLFAFASHTKYPAIITVDNLKSKPYIDLSLQLLQLFGYNVRHEDYTRFYITPFQQSMKPLTYHTEGDWSAAAFLLVAGAIAGPVELIGLKQDSVQADRAIIQVLQSAGAEVLISENSIQVIMGSQLNSFHFDATDAPDLFPPLVALASYCKGESVIRGLSRLGTKESNRAESLSEVFTRMGIEIICKNDSMFIKGGKIGSAVVSSHHDHRIAMACSVAALSASGAVTVTDAESVSKSYPDFYTHLQMLGATVSLQQ